MSEKDVERLAALRGPKRPLKRSAPANAGQLVPFERTLPGGQTVEVLVPVGVDPGFGHSRAASAASRLAGIAPRELADFVRLVTPEPNLSTATVPAMLRWGSAELPAPTRISQAQASLPTAATMTDQELVQWALDQVPLDANGVRMLRLPPGEPEDALAIEIPLDEQWFMDKRGQLKIKKLGRDEWLPLLIQTLLNPDQIRYGYARDTKGTNIRLRMVKQFNVEGVEANQVPVLGVFELGAQGWAGVTVHVLNEPIDPLQAFFGGTRVLWSRK